jgi:type IV pilus assembly protein PilW
MMINQPGRDTKSRFQQAGFSLVEIMVGLVIGMLSILVVLRVLTIYDAQRRTTVGAADSQVNGNIAFYTVTRNLQMAGYGIAGDSKFDSYSMSKCLNLAYKDISVSGIKPVVVANGVSDTVTVRWGTALTGGSLVTINQDPVGNNVPVLSNFGCEKDKNVYIGLEGACAMSKIDPDPAAVFTDGTGQDWITLKDDQAMQKGVAIKGARLACLGQWNEVEYSIKDNTLYGNAEPIVPEIVNIQAQYGISDSRTSNNVTAWVDPVGAWANPTNDDLNRIKAVRIAFVARDPLKNAEVISSACSSLDTPSPSGLCAWAGTGGSPAPKIDLSADPMWDHYRYQVFEAVIPIRNVIRLRDSL